MKNTIILLVTFIMLTSFNYKEYPEHSEIISISTAENKQCKFYKDEVRKLLEELIRMPVAMNQTLPFNFQKVPQKSTGQNLIRFKYNKGKYLGNNKLMVSKQVNTTDPTKIDIMIMPSGKALSENPFVALINIPNINYSWVSKLEDIYADPNAGSRFTHTMKLISQAGEIVNRPIGLHGNGQSAGDCWWLECLETAEALEDRLGTMSGSIKIDNSIRCVCAYKYAVINKGENCTCPAGGDPIHVQSKFHETIVKASDLTNFLRLYGADYNGPAVHCKNGKLYKGVGCPHNGKESTEDCPMFWIQRY